MKKKNMKLMILGALAMLIIIVMLQNMQSVETKILFFSIAMPRVMLLLATFLSGFGLGVVVTRR